MGLQEREEDRSQIDESIAWLPCLAALFFNIRQGLQKITLSSWP